MKAASYDLIDEPKPGPLSHLAVKPIWPLLAVMLGGAWISWPWFVVNGFAVGSPTRWRELAWAVAGPIGCLALILLLGQLAVQGVVGGLALRYLTISIVVYKLYVTYVLFTLQTQSFSLYEYFGGQLRSGFFALVAAMIFRSRVLGQMPDFLRIVLG
jgi:hypothetical protein